MLRPTVFLVSAEHALVPVKVRTVREQLALRDEHLAHQLGRADQRELAATQLQLHQVAVLLANAVEPFPRVRSVAAQVVQMADDGQRRRTRRVCTDAGSGLGCSGTVGG